MDDLNFEGKASTRFDKRLTNLSKRSYRQAHLVGDGLKDKGGGHSNQE